MTTSILHVCDKFGVAGSSIHGVSRLFHWWFPRFDARFHVELCGLKTPEPASIRLAQNGIPVTHLGLTRFDPRILLRLMRLVRRKNARILHVHGYAAADFGRLAARLTGARLVLHEHFADPRMPYYQAWADWMLKGFTDRAIAVSQSTADFLVRERHVPRARVEVILSGAPLDEFRPAPPATGRALRDEWGLADDAFLVGTIGRLNAQKGHEYLLRAARSLIERQPQARFVIVGDGDREAALRAQAREAGIENQVIFTGHRDDIPAVLAAIDCLAISSTYEGTPLVLFEAMAAAKAIVSTAIDGCREIIEDERTGLLIPPRDPAALAAALERVLTEPAVRAGLEQEAHRAAKRYDIESCVRKIEAVYDQLLAAS